MLTMSSSPRATTAGSGDKADNARGLRTGAVGEGEDGPRLTRLDRHPRMATCSIKVLFEGASRPPHCTHLSRKFVSA